VLCLNGLRFQSWIMAVNYCFLMRPKLRLGFRATFKDDQPLLQHMPLLMRLLSTATKTPSSLHPNFARNLGVSKRG
jgi:hypothetical protein